MAASAARRFDFMDMDMATVMAVSPPAEMR
jgi:hypothetical protein